MATVRVFYRVDGGITVRRAVEKLMLPDETYTEYFDREMAKQEAKGLIRKKLIGATHEDIDESQLPVYDSATRNKWRKKAGGGVKIDKAIVTRPEKRKKLEDNLDKELAKATPDMAKAMRLQRKLDKKESYD